MLDLRRFSPGMVDEVVIIHDGIKEKDQRLLGSILPSRFIRYEFPIRNDRVLKAEVIKYFSKMVFTKYECLRLLSDYRNVMWLDYDMVLAGDISELFSACDTGIKMMPGGAPVRQQLRNDVAEYDMKAEGICSCVFVLQDNLKDYMNLYRFCYQALEQYAEQLYLGDQAIFDFMIQKFDLKVVPIERDVYSVHPSDTENTSAAKILHAYGQPKFWSGLHNEQWVTNYKTWLQMGGSKQKKLTAVAGRFIRRSKSLLRQVLSAH